jgi:pimeloyl-ACP methyl ester carboxylesterase
MTIGSPGVSSFEVNAVPRTSPDGSPSRTLHNRRKRRHVYHLAGYDPIDCDAQYRRFAHQLHRFKRTWPVQASLSELVRSSEQSRAWWTVQAHADDWQVETVHEVLLWDDIVRADFARPMLPRLGRAAIAYFDFSVTGTLFRYFRANWRFGLFSLFPPVLLALFAAAAWVSAHFAVGFLGFAGRGGLMVELTVGLTFFFALLRWPGRRWRVQQALEAWIAAHDYLHGRREDIEARLDAFAEVILAPSRQTGVDEIVLVGHSMGAMLALDLVDRALAIDPEFGRRRSSVCVLTVSAIIPKFALHPAARRLRPTTARIVAEPSIAWAEFQSRVDPMGFYTYDPATLTRSGERLSGKPVIRHIQLDEMLTQESYSRHRRNYMRLHYQSVMANEKRAPYDYFMMICGPALFRSWMVSPAGLLDFMGTDAGL